MSDIVLSEGLLWNALLFAVIAFMGVILAKWHTEDSPFDMRHIFVDSKTHRVSLMKLGQMAALVVSTWGFIVLIQHDRMTEFYFVGYMLAWSGANLANKWIENKNPLSTKEQ